MYRRSIAVMLVLATMLCAIFGAAAAAGAVVNEQPPVVTGADGTAQITIYGLDGQFETMSFKVGEKFTVYTTLNTSASSAKGEISAVTAAQVFSPELVSYAGALNGTAIGNKEKVFPYLEGMVEANITNGNTIKYTCASAAKAMRFNKEEKVLSAFEYVVKAAGVGEIKNELVSLTAADERLTPIYRYGQLRDGEQIAVNAHFQQPPHVHDIVAVRAVPAKIGQWNGLLWYETYRVFRM